MTNAEINLLLLCCQLGDPRCKPLSIAKLRELELRVRTYCGVDILYPEVFSSGFSKLGYSDDQFSNILSLLNRKSLLESYIQSASNRGIHPLTKYSSAYPQSILRKAPERCPPVLFTLGEIRLLNNPAVGVIGSRKLNRENHRFAEEIGARIAEDEYILVSGGAVGADQAAQLSCLDHGGSCIIFTPHRLTSQSLDSHILYISAGGYDIPFSAERALFRNTLIHMYADKVFAAQCTYGKGGTWQGSLQNLKHGWSPLFVFHDSSDGAVALIQRGATGVRSVNSIAQMNSRQLALF